ncbi:MAG: GAF domain-containing protein [Anaerolineae bacterium]|nr:GAF domain-containing protein [Anaerolineae bacterium]
MGIPDAHKNLKQEMARLTTIAENMIEALRAQKEILRQRGMGLPPGALAGLKEVQNNLHTFAQNPPGGSNNLEHLRALAQTTELINSSLDTNTVLNEVMDTVIRLTGAERGYIVLRNEKSGEMEFRIARNVERETLDEGDLIFSRTIVSEVAQSGHPVLTNDALADPNWNASESVVIHALRSVMCAPLVVKDKVTGVIYVDNSIRDAVFGNEQLRLMSDFANQAAVAIENAQLFGRVQTALAEVTEMKDMIDNVLASITSGVITTDVAKIVTTYNAAAERILQIPPDMVIGTQLDAALPLVYHYVRDLIEVVYRNDSQELLEIDPVLPNRGEVNLNLNLTPLKNQAETEGITIVVDDVTEIKKRDAKLDVVRRYLPPAMVDNIQSLDGLGLGGERRFITVIFVESRPFHAFPENIHPQDLMEQLNLYLTAGAEAIHHQSGVIDKFMGNEIMGLFNTQLNPCDDHAWRAVLSALKIVDDYMALAPPDDPHLPYYRVGIHTGVATLGNVGSLSRREFTAIGDTVNLGKRLQENAKPGQIIMSDATYQACAEQLHDQANGILVEERESIQVKGRFQTVKIFNIQRAHP